MIFDNFEHNFSIILSAATKKYVIISTFNLKDFNFQPSTFNLL